MNDFDKEPLTPNDFSEINLFLGNKLKQARTEQGLSILDVSKISGMAGSYISLVENGKKPKVSLYTFLRLMYFLDIDPCDIFSNVEKLHPFNKKY